VVVLAGCGGPNHEFTEVQGTVTLGGKPLPGVKVAFYPDSEDAEMPYASGLTNENGIYTLARPDGKPGALVGRNVVVVMRPPRDRNPDAPPPPQGPAVPVVYSQAAETPLVVEVKAGGPQTIDLPLVLNPAPRNP
jgi:hypothetical protein